MESSASDEPRTTSELIKGFPSSSHAPVAEVQFIFDGNRDEPSWLRAGTVWPDPVWNTVPNALVGPFSVEVFDVFLDFAMKVPIPDSQEVIKAISHHVA